MAKAKKDAADRTSADVTTPIRNVPEPEPPIASAALREPESFPETSGKVPPAGTMVRATQRGQYRKQQVRAGQTFRLVEGEPFNPHWMEAAPDDAPDTLAPAGTGTVFAPGGAPERPRKTRTSADANKTGDDELDVL
jgi:hypothetical protein